MITAEEKKRIEKFEKRHKTHHHIPFGVCRKIGNKRSVSDFNRDRLDTKIFQPFKQDLKWPARYICSPCKAQYAQDYHYDHELRMVRISWWWIDAHWGGAQERDWQRISTTYYVDIDTCKIFDNRFQEKSRANDYFSVWYRDNREEFRRWCSSYSLVCPSGEVIEQIIEEAIKDNPALENNLSKRFSIGGECYPWVILNLFRKAPKAPKTNPSSRDIEIQHFKEICDSDSQHEVKEEQFNNGEHSVYTVEPMGLYKKLPLYLIRIYTNPYPYEYSYSKINGPHECGRLYFTRKMSTYFYRSGSKWVYEARPTLYYQLRMASFQKNNGDIFSCASNSIRKFDITPDTLVRIVKDKCSEQAIKAGCWYLANRWIMSRDNRGSSFGPCDYSKNTIFKIVRITPSQARVIENYMITSSNDNNYRGDTYRIIRQLKEFFKTNEISSIGNAIEKYLPYMRCLEVWNCDMEAVDNLIKKAANISREYGVINIVRDTCMQLKSHSIDENDYVVDWKELIKDVRTQNDLLALHDRTIVIANLQIAKRQKAEYERRKALEEKYKKNLKERMGYEYENEQFLIRLPQTGLEIANEGHSLHHCVGGYVENHLRGETTILFLRKKEKPDESFYTIEVSSDGVVRQIHGACNKWLGNDPDAARFAWHWSKDKNIPCPDAIIRSVAKGYSSHNADMLPESELY